MEDSEARGIQECVKVYKQDTHGFDAAHLKHFENLVNLVRSQFANLNDDDLLVVTAMCLFGPEQAAGPSPPDMRHDLLSVVQHVVPHDAERRQRIRECAIAYGCGKWRQVTKGYGGWEQRWEGAICALAREFEQPIREAYTWLAEHIVGCNSVVEQKQNRHVWSEAIMLTRQLIRPQHSLHIGQAQRLHITCTAQGTLHHIPTQDWETLVPFGAKAVFTVAAPLTLQTPRNVSFEVGIGIRLITTAREEETRIEATANDTNRRIRLRQGETAFVPGPTTLELWECACGHKECAKRHRLEAWSPVMVGSNNNPVKVSLRAFVASAVKGPAEKPRKQSDTNGVPAARDATKKRPSRIRTGAFAQAMLCWAFGAGGSNPGRLRLVAVESKVCTTCEGKEYEGFRCGQCQRSFNPIKDSRVVHDRLILVDVDPPPYERQHHYRCPACKYLYTLSEDDIIVRAKCRQCQQPLFHEQQLRKIWKGAETLLQHARRLDRERRKKTTCSNTNCQASILAVCWCPLCEASSAPMASSCLPQNPIVVWTRTFHAATSFDELQGYGLL